MYLSSNTQMLIVHAGYSKYRRELLEAGIGLYELKRGDRMSAEAEMHVKPLGLSGASLHAKTFVVDGLLETVSYRPELTPEDKMVWQETIGIGNTVTWFEEPNASGLQRFAITVIGWLPVEWLL